MKDSWGWFKLCSTGLRHCKRIPAQGPRGTPWHHGTVGFAIHKAWWTNWEVDNPVQAMTMRHALHIVALSLCEGSGEARRPGLGNHDSPEVINGQKAQPWQSWFARRPSLGNERWLIWLPEGPALAMRDPLMAGNVPNEGETTQDGTEAPHADWLSSGFVFQFIHGHLWPAERVWLQHIAPSKSLILCASRNPTSPSRTRS